MMWVIYLTSFNSTWFGITFEMSGTRVFRLCAKFLTQTRRITSFFQLMQGVHFIWKILF